MVKRLILNTFVWFLIVGCIGYAVAWILGDPTPTILSEYTVNYGNGVSITMYKLDVHGYLVNLQNTINIPWQDMWYDFPEPWAPSNWADATILFKQIYNAYIWIINVFVWLNNIVIIMPTKLLLHPLMLTLSLLGIDTTNLGLVTIANRLYDLNPTPIQYWA